MHETRLVYSLAGPCHLMVYIAQDRFELYTNATGCAATFVPNSSGLAA